jgi:hypothetical protein
VVGGEGKQLGSNGAVFPEEELETHTIAEWKEEKKGLVNMTQHSLVSVSGLSCYCSHSLGPGSEVSFRPLSPSPIENLGFRPHGCRMHNVFHLWDVCSFNVSKFTIALHPRVSNKWVLSKHFQIVLANLYGSQRCGPQQKLQKLWRGVFHAEELIFPK